VQGEKCVTDSNSDDRSNQRGGDNQDEQIATLGEEEGAKEASYVIPIRHRRRKGLWELGKSSRRSQGKIRLEAVNISDESCRDSRVNKISNIVSDGDIAKGNSRCRKDGKEEEPLDLWVAGKWLGVACQEDEDDVVKEIEKWKQEILRF